MLKIILSISAGLISAKGRYIDRLGNVLGYNQTFTCEEHALEDLMGLRHADCEFSIVINRSMT